MEINSIFEESESQHKQEYVTYSDRLVGDKYVSQFLQGFNAAVDMDINEPQVVEAMQMPEFEEFLQENNKESIEVEVKAHKKKRAQCTFHNFQKHLVTTLRYNIKLSEINFPPETRQCIMKIWECFKNSSKLNKTLITLLFSDINQENPIKLANYGFAQIIEEFSQQIITQSQQILIQRLTVMLQNLNIEQTLNHRRMKNKKDFILYYKQFMKQVIDGRLDRRMIKCTKLLKKLNKQRKQLQN